MRRVLCVLMIAAFAMAPLAEAKSHGISNRAARKRLILKKQKKDKKKPAAKWGAGKKTKPAAH